MLRAYKYRIYPTNGQRVLLVKTFGCVRYFWNQCVATFNSYDKETNPHPTYKTSTQLRGDIEWMKEISAAAIQQKEIDFKEYRDQKFSGNRKGKLLGRPQFKKRSNRQSYRLPNQKFNLKDEKIRLEKVGWIKMVIDREIPKGSKYINVTVSKNPVNQYFVTVLVECEIKTLNKTNITIGMDVGLKTFASLSNGSKVANPRFYRENQAKLAHLQRIWSRKVKGSNRWHKLRIRIARLHNQTANQRAHFLHTESTRLVRLFDIIYVEDLNVAGMSSTCKPIQDETGKYLPNGQSHKKGLNKSIMDAGWATFMAMLAYKCNWYGKELVKIDRFAPSSKTCSYCGLVNHDLILQDRMFVCPACGLSIDRDLNAAINIHALGVDGAERMQRERVADPIEASKN